MRNNAHSLSQWYLTYRAHGEKPKSALNIARLSHQAESEASARLSRLSAASRARISRFVDCFIRSSAVELLTAERDADFINEPESGAGGRTHYETIADWRVAFSQWLSDKRTWNDHDRFEAAVRAHFDLTELWHDFHGSLWQEVG